MPDDASRVARWERRTEWPLIALALLFLIAYATPILAPDMSADLKTAWHVALFGTWVLFGIDYLVRIGLAECRWQYAWHHLSDLAVLAIPALRPLRLLRALRSIPALNRSGASLRGRIAIYVSAATALLLFCASLAVLNAERGHDGANIGGFGDALWWAASTFTTIGYGDRYPVTAWGRCVAGGLMLGGVALLGIVTATIASWLAQRVEEVEGSAQAHSRAEIHWGCPALTDRVDGLVRLPSPGLLSWLPLRTRWVSGIRACCAAWCR
jgi:voltage-gated potassium channel